MNYKTLPKGYRYAGAMDFTRNRKQILALFKFAVALIVIPMVLGLLSTFLARFGPPVTPVVRARFSDTWYLWPVTLAMLAAYIPLHELTHGVVMYALSGVRPKYGLKLPYAYAGSTAWFDRRSHAITALAPVILWGAALQTAILLLPREWFWPLWIVQISNLSGSAGDIYCVWYLARMEGELLIQDSGVRMRIFKKTDLPVEETDS